MKESVAYLHSRSPQSTKKWYHELKVLQKSLEVFPSRLPRYNSLRLGDTSYHVAVHYSHKVIFRIDERNKSVCIARTYHSARKPFESDEAVEVE